MPNPPDLPVIAHPHPLHGGTLDNKVVFTLFNSVLELGYIAVKFNFRGVGKSDGVFDNGAGEVDDVIAVTQAVTRELAVHQDDLPLLLAGFSFGGGVQIRAAERLTPRSLVLVAPSLRHIESATQIPVGVAHTLIIQGDKDDIVPLDGILDWATPQSLPILVIPGAEHFFHGKLTLLKQAVLNFSR